MIVQRQVAHIIIGREVCGCGRPRWIRTGLGNGAFEGEDMAKASAIDVLTWPELARRLSKFRGITEEADG